VNNTDATGAGTGWGRVILINVAVFLILIAAVEGAVRLLNPEIAPVGTHSGLFAEGVYEETGGPRPGAAGESNGVMRRVDDRGFWAYSAARPEQPKWLLLGDSVTMGLGVEGDSTYAGILAAAQDSLDVINASIPGHASDDYLSIARVLVDSLDVRRITLFWCLNDVMAGRPVDTAPTGARVLDNSLMAFVRRHVRTYSWAKAAFTDRPRLYYQHDAALYDPTRGYLETALAHLEDVHALAAARGIALDIVLLPYEYGLRAVESGPRQIISEKLAERLSAPGVEVLDAGRALRAADDPERLYLYGDGIHFNRRGHRAIAEIVADFVADRN